MSGMLPLDFNCSLDQYNLRIDNVFDKLTQLKLSYYSKSRHITEPFLHNMAAIKTRFLILSDTYGKDVVVARNIQNIDVVIHCGNLTKDSQLEEYDETIKMLNAIDAPVKIAIPGSLDLALEPAGYEELFVHSPVSHATFETTHGEYGEARKRFQRAGIHLLGEGFREFQLENGAVLKLFASQYTPRWSEERGVTYRYNLGTHHFDVPSNVDVAITHGPPAGVLDIPAPVPDSDTDTREPLGCPNLFSAISRAKPKLHCFGRVHGNWGSELVTWKQLPPLGVRATRTNAVDECNSVEVTRLEDFVITSADLKAGDQGKVEERKVCERRGFVYANPLAPTPDPATCGNGNGSGSTDGKGKGKGEKEDRLVLPARGETLFVNAAMEAVDQPRHLPFVAEIGLPMSQERKIQLLLESIGRLGFEGDEGEARQAC